MVDALLDNPIALAALVGALAGALVNLAVASVKGLFRLYSLRQGRVFQKRIDLQAWGQTRWREGELLAYLTLEAHNIGGVRTRITTATVGVSTRLVQSGDPQGMRASVWGEPELFEAFTTSEEPEVLLDPGQSRRDQLVIELPPDTQPPLKLRLDASSTERDWWTRGLADAEDAGDNEG